MHTARITAAVFGAAFTLAGCVSMNELGESIAQNLSQNLSENFGDAFAQNRGEAPRTPLTVVNWADAPEGPYQAHAGARVLTQYLTPQLLVELIGEAAPDRGVGPDALAPGARLVGVVDRDGRVRYCARQTVETDAEPLLTCLEDVDDDGAFDVAWTALGYDDAFAFAVRRWIERYPLAGKVSYAPRDPATGPLQQIAIAYVGRGRDGAYGFALAVGGRDGFTAAGGAPRTAWIVPEDGALDVAGARIEIVSTTRRGDIVYRLGSTIDSQPLTLQVSNAQRTLGQLVVTDDPNRDA